jgi:uncharacterized membrane-anchored protein YjiN (DUF445 family)
MPDVAKKSVAEPKQGAVRGALLASWANDQEARLSFKSVLNVLIVFWKTSAIARWFCSIVRHYMHRNSPNTSRTVNVQQTKTHSICESGGGPLHRDSV